MRYDFVAVGELMLDVIAPEPEPGGVVHASVHVRAGGTPVNAAFAATNAGASAAVVGRIGDDGSGVALRHELQAAGVSALVAVDRRLPTGTFLEVGQSVVADRGANAALEPGDIPAGIACDVLLVSGYAFLHDDARAGAAAALATVDAAWRGLTAGSAHLAARLSTEAHGADALFLNAEEARRLGGGPERVLEPGPLREHPRLVCVTLGPEGVVGTLDGQIARQPAVVGGTSAPGGGDALAAGVLLALARGASLDDALRRGVESAAAFSRSRTPGGGARATAPGSPARES